MKLFRNGIAFILVVLGASFTHAQTFTFYDGPATGTFENSADWSNGVPNATTIAEILTGGDFTGLTSPSQTVPISNLNNITITEITNQQAAGVVIFPVHTINTGATTPGTVNLNIASGATLTV